MKVVFFTGAGVSAESGIKTFRDTNGLWEESSIEEVCNIETWELNKEAVFKFYSERRKDLEKAKPNHIHETIAKIQKLLGSENVEILTQNVDDLFERAGCENVIHLHGFLREMRCLSCGEIFDIGYEESTTKDKCPKCGEQNLKPNIVFFGENAPKYHFLNRSLRFIDNNDIFIVMGTMGNVIPIDWKLNNTFYKPITILNNLEPSPFLKEETFDYIFYEKGTSAIDKIEKIIMSKVSMY